MSDEEFEKIEEDCGLTKEAVNKCVDLLNKKIY